MIDSKHLKSLRNLVIGEIFGSLSVIFEERQNR